MQLSLSSNNVGNGFTKARTAQRQISFPSVGAIEQGAVKFDTQLNTPENGRKQPDLIIEYGGEVWALGDAAYKYGRMQVQDMSRARIQEKSYQLLYLASLAATMRQTSLLAVIASLPIRQYNSDRESARHILSGTYSVRHAGKAFTYTILPENVYIVPEGFGALCTRVLSPTGKIADSEFARARVGTVDVGTRTVGLLKTSKLEIIPAESDMRDNLGMATVWKLLQEDINRSYGIELNNLQLDAVMHDRYFMDSGYKVDVGDFCDRASQALAEAIIGLINSTWENGRSVDSILLTGGGAQFIYPFISYRHKLLSDCGYFDNCEGAYRFGLLRGLGL